MRLLPLESSPEKQSYLENYVEFPASCKRAYGCIGGKGAVVLQSLKMTQDLYSKLRSWSSQMGYPPQAIPLPYQQQSSLWSHASICGLTATVSSCPTGLIERAMDWDQCCFGFFSLVTSLPMRNLLGRLEAIRYKVVKPWLCLPLIWPLPQIHGILTLHCPISLFRGVG